MDILSPQYIAGHIENIKCIGKFGLANSTANISDLKSSDISNKETHHNIFNVSIPFASSNINIQVFFINGVPDIILQDDRFYPSISDLSTLNEWDNTSSSLLSVIEQLYTFFRLKMKEIVREKASDNLMNIYDVYGDNNVEIYINPKGEESLLLKLNVDFDILPNYNKSDLLICLLSVVNSESKVIISPDAVRVLQCTEIEIKNYNPKGEQLAFYILEITSIINSKVEDILNIYKMRLEIFNELEKTEGISIIEKDVVYLKSVYYRILYMDYTAVVHLNEEKLNVISIYDQQLNSYKPQNCKKNFRIDYNGSVDRNVQQILQFFKKTMIYMKQTNNIV